MTEEKFQILRSTTQEKHAIYTFLEEAKLSKLVIFWDTQYHTDI